jgi:hypothetical protein
VVIVNITDIFNGKLIVKEVNDTQFRDIIISHIECV